MTFGNKLFWIILLSLFFIINIAASFIKIKHLKKRKAAKNVYKNINKIENDNKDWLFSYLRKIDPFVFEELILLTFKKNGFKIKHKKQYSHYSVVDGCVRKNGNNYLFQAKRYSDDINESHVKEFIKICRYNKCCGYFIYTGKTGIETKKLFTETPQIKIISGEKLYEFFGKNKQKSNNLTF